MTKPHRLLTAADVVRLAPRGWRCTVTHDDSDDIYVRATSDLRQTRGEVMIVLKDGRVEEGETFTGELWVDRSRQRWEGRLAKLQNSPAAEPLGKPIRTRPARTRAAGVKLVGAGVKVGWSPLGWMPHTITAETSRSWVLPDGRKVAKRGEPRVAFTQAEIRAKDTEAAVRKFMMGRAYKVGHHLDSWLRQDPPPDKVLELLKLIESPYAEEFVGLVGAWGDALNNVLAERQEGG